VHDQRPSGDSGLGAMMRACNQATTRDLAPSCCTFKTHLSVKPYKGTSCSSPMLYHSRAGSAHAQCPATSTGCQSVHPLQRRISEHSYYYRLERCSGLPFAPATNEDSTGDTSACSPAQHAVWSDAPQSCTCTDNAAASTSSMYPAPSAARTTATVMSAAAASSLTCTAGNMRPADAAPAEHV
jgi:hypothetical protein